MFNVNEFWKKRFDQERKTILSYSRYMFNDHFKVVVIFLLLIGAYFYQKWLETVPANYSFTIFIAVILGFILTKGSVSSFLKRADLVFLLPLENKMGPYFRRAFRVSYIAQLSGVWIAIGVLAPLYFHHPQASNVKFFIALLLISASKWVNLYGDWTVKRVNDQRRIVVDQIVRGAINVIFVYLLFHPTLFLYAFAVVIVYLFLLYDYKFNIEKHYGLTWEVLVEQQEQKLMRFYRFANLFTDVPKLTMRVKKRLYLNPMLNAISFLPKETFTYLFARAYIRSGDYLMLSVRLVVLGIVGFFALSFPYHLVVITVLTLYLTGYQMIPLWQHYQWSFMTQLYPISFQTKKSSFLKLLHLILVAELIALGIGASFVSDSVSLLMLQLIISYGFIISFVYGYVNQRIRQMKNNPSL